MNYLDDFIPGQETWPKGRLGLYAGGSYYCRCGKCSGLYEGDKRSTRCYPCAVKEQQMVIERNVGSGI
jgi:hypothetical protein